ncbi:MAG: nicotinate phosphoribosyltransferase [Ruminococcaceae bacterium]|nr:nicotinate phosphoribosyltransferase [Oscillospiraceae bacterium]
MSNNLNKRNLTLLTDFYELTMAGGYFECEHRDRIAYFDMFYRNNPDKGGYAIMAGVEQMVEYLTSLKFTDEDIDFLRTKNCFTEGFLEYLRNFKFECDVWAVPEGTPIFPGEPIVTVKGPLIQAQFVETMILLSINHQSLIATKANRLARAAKGRAVMEFGSRRAQGYDGAILGARAAYIGGCCGTACTICERDFGVPALGTMAHSWIQSFDTEYEAFATYAKLYPNNCTLLVDTYNTLKSGIPNAIKVFDEVLAPMGYRPNGIRIDSGDITYLSKKARKMLDAAGYEDCKICASNSLDEFIIKDMQIQGAQVDTYGVGERLITSSSSPVFGGVYKLVATEQDGVMTPKIKISENVGKITTPCFKRLYRLYDKETGKSIADVICLHDEVIDDTQPYEIFDPINTWKRKTIENFYAVDIRKKYIEKGKLIEEMPDIETIKAYCQSQLETLWDEVTRFENPHTYYVDLSQKLWDIKNELLNKGKK